MAERLEAGNSCVLSAVVFKDLRYVREASDGCQVDYEESQSHDELREPCPWSDLGDQPMSHNGRSDAKDEGGHHDPDQQCPSYSGSFEPSSISVLDTSGPEKRGQGQPYGCAKSDDATKHGNACAAAGARHLEQVSHDRSVRCPCR